MVIEEAQAVVEVELCADHQLHAELGDATVALFPYRPELDQSGAMLQALGAGVPAVVYDVGGLAEPVERFGAGRVVPPGDVEALAQPRVVSPAVPSTRKNHAWTASPDAPTADRYCLGILAPLWASRLR